MAKTPHPKRNSSRRSSVEGELLTRDPEDAVAAPDRVEAVLAAADRSGLREQKTERISGRVSPDLVRQAKEHTGISSDTELLEFALANLALVDRFAEAFHSVRGRVDKELELGF
jgi:hypothetical protein